MKNRNKTLGITLAATLGAAGAAGAADSPFAMQSMDKGYMVAQADKMPAGKCGAGMCGGAMKAKSAEAKSAEAKCGAGKCSVDVMDANKDGKVDKAEFLKHHEAMFGKMDANKDGKVDAGELAKWKDGVCAASKAGEGKCGGKK